MEYNFLNKKCLLQVIFLCTLTIAGGNVSGKDLIVTPRQTEGPFYPDKYPVDTDNDLVMINNSTEKAGGDIVHLTGIVTDSKGKPLENAVIEIWQADSNRVYIHSQSPDQGKRDKNFQGFGRVITGSSGEYYFRTLMPVSYTMGRITRAPHIHFVVMINSERMLTSQIYIKGNGLNDRDMVLQGIKNEKQREALQPEFVPQKNKGNEYFVSFNIVIGTVSENTGDDRMRYLDGSIGR